MCRKILLSFVFTFVLSLLNCFAGDSQSPDQHEELFFNGTITDSRGRVWNVRFIPGINNINNNVVKAWKSSSETLDNLADSKFYKEWVVESFLDGIKFAFDFTWNDFLFKGVDEDISEFERIWNEEDTFGGALGKFLGGAYTGIKLVARTLLAPVLSVAGITYAVVVPTGAVVSQPIGATLESLFAGVAYPTVMYVWNGVAWVATYFNDVPQKEGAFVRLATNDGKTLIVDKKGFDAILMGTVLEHLTEEERIVLQKNILDIEKAMDSQVLGNTHELTLNEADLEKYVSEILKQIGRKEPEKNLVQEIVKDDIAQIEALIQKPVS